LNIFMLIWVKQQYCLMFFWHSFLHADPLHY
jgi:hypothetical protein